MHPIHRVGITRFSQRDNPPVANSDVGLDHTPMIENDRPRNNQVGSAFSARRARLSHGLARRLAAAEDHLVSTPPTIPLHFDNTIGFRKTDAVPPRRPLRPPQL